LLYLTFLVFIPTSFIAAVHPHDGFMVEYKTAIAQL